MRTSEFNYTLPEGLIAQQPCEKRDHSRMMIVDREKETIECGHFFDLHRFVTAGDVLMVNDSKVIPARLYGRKITGGTIEILLLGKPGTVHTSEVLLRPAKRVVVGTKIFFGNNSWAEVKERLSEKKWILDFHIKTPLEEFLKEYGKAPLPPYIKRNRQNNNTGECDLERYQTVYAKNPGSVAAPTAGLHFSEEMIDTLRKNNIIIAPITLHVGYGTFVPIETENVEDHRMEREFFEITEGTARAINNANRVIAVGTTSVRTLETVSDDHGTVSPGQGQTDLFIYPPYRFKRVNGLLTNFHLPQSSLFLLVCAFAGRELMLEAYRKAIEERFRFYSYGDCMLIL
jgi:S-adenosylmethionine:tRNA ribosyltransferase-isomerase